MTLLTKETLSVLMTGLTHYVALNEGREAVIHYGLASNAYLRLPDGNSRSGCWHLCDDGYDVAWEDGPSARWHIAYAAGQFTYLDADRQTRGTVTRIACGNPEGFGA